MGVESLIVLAIATFAGALIQAATGFGFAIVAAPVFLAVLNATSAIAILTALHVVQSLVLVPRVIMRASPWHLKRLIAGALIGAPIGIWMFKSLSVSALKVLVGLTILLVLALILWRERVTAGPTWARTARPHGTFATLLTGAVSSAMTVLLVMPGPPLMTYFMSQRHSAAAVRALSLTFFGVCYVALTLHHHFVVGFTHDAQFIIGALAPVVIAGTFAGMALVPRFTDQGFRLAVLALLMLSGLGAILSAVLP